jgi:hypothetical protein
MVWWVINSFNMTAENIVAEMAKKIAFMVMPQGAVRAKMKQRLF